MITRISKLLLLSASFFTLFGCGTFATYFNNRLNDLSDIIDVKYNTDIKNDTCAIIKIQLTDYLCTGIGYQSGCFKEKYGRKYIDNVQAEYYFVLLNAEKRIFEKSYSKLSVLGLPAFWLKSVMYWEDVEWYKRFRFGFELGIVKVSFGIYINVGEIIDFIFGLIGIDLFGDDEE